MVETSEQFVKAAVLYNPLDIKAVETHEIVYNPEFTLADYLEGMSDYATWVVGYRGEAYERDRWDTIKPEPGEGFSLVLALEGGGSSGSGKEVLRMVAMIAVMVAAWYLGPAIAVAMGSLSPIAAGIATATIATAGMMLVNAVIPPAGLTKLKETSASYGVDGPKNTSQEGVVVPVVYGTYRVGGNIVDLYTKNVGDDQYLFMRTVLNDGRVAAITDVEINDQPLSNFTNVETRIQLGDEDGESNDWFGEAIRLTNRNVKLSTNWLTHTTTTDVDRVRLDLVYPKGLCFKKGDGRVLSAESSLAIEYKLQSAPASAWAPLPSGYEQTFLGMSSGVGSLPGYGVSPDPFQGSMDRYGGIVSGYNAGQNQVTLVNGITYTGTYSATQVTNPTSGALEGTVVATSPAGASRLTISALAEIYAETTGSLTGTYNMKVGYRKVGTTAWTYVGDEDGTVERAQSNNVWQNFPLVYRTYEARVDPAFRYEVTAFGGNVSSASAYMTSAATSVLSLTRAKEETFRYSFESAALPRGTYDIRIRRTVAEEAETSSRRDQVYLTDVGEIDLDNIHYIGTANLSLKIKLNDQLNGVPKMTALVQGSVVKKYDEEGNVTATEWSPYPCWHVLDILLNQDRGRAVKTSRIDFAAFKEWEQHCIDNDIQFNAIFDSDSNVWDATQTIGRVGGAALLRVGTKYSVIIDKPSDPVMLFNDANIIKDTFETQWLPVSERANEIHYTFTDKTDGFKQHTVRAIDPAATNTGIGLKVAQVTQVGVTSLEQARRDVEKQLRENRLLKKAITFEAPIESIALGLGEVAAVQHNSANYGKGIGTGRLKSGSTLTTLNLDSAVTMEAGKTYRLLLIQSAVKRYTVTIVSVSGNNVYVSGLPQGGIAKCARLLQGGRDVEVVDIFDGTPNDRILLKNGTGFIAGQAELWDTDVIEEHTVNHTGTVTSDVVTLATPLLAAPPTYANWMIGPVETVKKLYRLRDISGNDIHRRKLSFIEYNPLVYSPLDLPIETTPRPSSLVKHVSGLLLKWPDLIGGEATRVTARLSWSAADASEYGGADVYQNLDGNGWVFVRSVTDVTGIDVELNLNDDVQYRVVACNKQGIRAPIITAPVVGAYISPVYPTLAPPTELSVSVGDFKATATLNLHWVAPETATEATSYRLSYMAVSQNVYNAFLGGTWQEGDYAESPEWKEISYTKDTKGTLTNQNASFAIFRVRREEGRSVSVWTHSSFNVNAPTMPGQITGLRLNGGTPNVPSAAFATADANWTWDDILSQAAGATSDAAYNLLDYQVRILTPDLDLIRVEHTRTPSYTYTYAKNAEDAAKASVAPRRDFVIEVTIRGLQGQISAPRTMLASNSAPAAPAFVSPVGTLNSLEVAWEQCADKDYVASHVHIGSTVNFVPTDANRVYVGSSDRTAISVAIAGEKYVRVGHADSFGNGPTNYSTAEMVYVPYIAIETLTEISEIGADIGSLVTGLNEQIDTVQASVEAEIDKAALAGLEMLTKAAADKEDALVKHRQQGIVVKTVEEAADDAVTKLNILGVFDKENETVILDQSKVKLSPTESFASKFESINTKFEDTESLISSTAESLSDATGSVASKVDVLGVLSPDGQSFILDQSKVKIGPSETLASRFSSINSDFGDYNSLIATNAQTAADATEAVASVVSKIGVVSPDGSSFIIDSDRVKVNGSESIAQRFSSINTELNGYDGVVATNARAASSATSSVASVVGKIGALSPDGQSFIISDQTAKIYRTDGGVEGLASAMTQLRTDVGDNYSYIGSVETVMTRDILSTTNSWSLASQINTVAGTFNGLSGSVTTLSTVTYTQVIPNVNQLNVRYGVSLNNNGHITGFVMNNDGATGDFTIVADRFAIVDPSAPANVRSPFVYSGGLVRMSNVEVDTFKADSIETNNLKDNSVSTSVFSYTTSQWNSVYDGASLVSASMAPSSNRGVKIDFYGNFHFPSSRTVLLLQLYRNGSPVNGAFSKASFDGQDEVPMTIIFFDPSAVAGQNYIYDVVKQAGTNIDFLGGSIYVQELKR